MINCELAVIGGGPAGYVAAATAARLGMDVILFEKKSVGGTCLNRGCIPTKTYLSLSKDYTRIKKNPAVAIDKIIFDLKKAKEHKNEVVNKLINNINILLKKRGVRIVETAATIKENGSIIAGEEEYSYKKLIIATGSEPREIPPFKFDRKFILDSTDVLELDEVPESMGIIGGGVVGMEFATFFSEIGCNVHVIELEKNILAQEDKKTAKRLMAILKKKGIQFHTGVSVENYKIDGVVQLQLSNGVTIEVEKVLVGVGRSRNSSDMGLEKLGINMDRDMIIVDEKCETNVKDHYACGDIATNVLLAHAASRMGEIAAANAAGGNEICDLSLVPGCIYTHPELSSIGKKVEEIEEEIKTGKFMFGGVGRAVCQGEEEGFVEVIASAETGRILGGTILGPDASELINLINYAINGKMTLSEIAHIIHPHPTLSEGVAEAFLSANGTPVHGI